MRNLFAVVLVLTAVGIVADGHVAARSGVDVVVLEQHCSPDGIDALTLRLTNPTGETMEMTAHVWSSKQHVQFSWVPVDLRVPPGERTITIRPPDDRGVIVGDQAQVWLADGQERAIENFEVRRCK